MLLQPGKRLGCGRWGWRAELKKYTLNNSYYERLRSPMPIKKRWCKDGVETRKSRGAAAGGVLFGFWGKR